VDLAGTRAQAKGVALAVSHEGGQCPAFTRAGQNVATVVMLLGTLPPPSTDGVDRLYHQLGEILSISAVWQVECTRWRRVKD
jgi:hypothetical protein